MENIPNVDTLETIDVGPHMWGRSDWDTLLPRTATGLAEELRMGDEHDLLWELVGLLGALADGMPASWWVVSRGRHDNSGTDYRIGTPYRVVAAEDACSGEARRCFRLEADVFVQASCCEVLVDGEGSDAEAVMEIGCTPPRRVVRFTGAVVGNLIADAFRGGAMLRAAVSTLPDGPPAAASPINVGYPPELRDWLQVHRVGRGRRWHDPMPEPMRTWARELLGSDA